MALKHARLALAENLPEAIQEKISRSSGLVVIQTIYEESPPKECAKHNCSNKPYKKNKLSPVVSVWKCKKHYYEHR